MKKIVLFTFALFAIVGCGDDDNQSGTGGNNTPVNVQFTTLGKGDATPDSTDPINPHYYILRSQSEWNAFKEQTDIQTDGAVDFSLHEVIVVFDDYRDNGGYSIEIKSITKMDSKLTVKLEKTGEGVTALGTQPYHAVRIQKTGFPVVFEEDSPL